MRQIKFRGKRITDGKVICSSIVDLSSTSVQFGHWCKCHGNWMLRWELVAPESVQQLIGVDKNGLEVYEGDKVDLLEYNCLLPPTEATFAHYAGILDGEIVGHISED